jgi:hypothetical protein
MAIFVLLNLTSNNSKCSELCSFFVSICWKESLKFVEPALYSDGTERDFISTFWEKENWKLEVSG